MSKPIESDMFGGFEMQFDTQNMIFTLGDGMREILVLMKPPFAALLTFGDQKIAFLSQLGAIRPSKTLFEGYEGVRLT